MDVYQTLNDTSGSRSAADVPIGTVERLVGEAQVVAAYEVRVKGRPMLLHNPRKESLARIQRKAITARQNDDKIRRKENRGTRTERRAAKSTIQNLKYETFLDIHTLWVDYMSELLNLRSLSTTNDLLEANISSHAMAMQTKLVKADFHGCKLSVKASKCPTLVGSSGIVIEETANVFRIVTPKHRVKVLPKQNSVFAFTIPFGQDLSHIQFELYGNQFRFRADDRASRKFKSKNTIEL